MSGICRHYHRDLEGFKFYCRCSQKATIFSRDNMDNEEELDGIVQSTKRRADKEGVEALLEEDGQGKGKKRKEKGLLDRMADAPYPLTHMLMLGGNGFLLSLGAVVLGFFIRWNTLSAVSAALTCHLFGLAFFVSEVHTLFDLIVSRSLSSHDSALSPSLEI